MECVQGTSESASRPCLDSQTRILVTYWLWGYLKEKVVFLDNHQTWRDLMHSFCSYSFHACIASPMSEHNSLWVAAVYKCLMTRAIYCSSSPEGANFPVQFDLIRLFLFPANKLFQLINYSRKWSRLWMMKRLSEILVLQWILPLCKTTTDTSFVNLKEDTHF